MFPNDLLSHISKTTEMPTGFRFCRYKFRWHSTCRNGAETYCWPRGTTLVLCDGFYIWSGPHALLTTSDAPVGAGGTVCRFFPSTTNWASVTETKRRAAEAAIYRTDRLRSRPSCGHPMRMIRRRPRSDAGCGASSRAANGARDDAQNRWASERHQVERIRHGSFRVREAACRNGRCLVARGYRLSLS